MAERREEGLKQAIDANNVGFRMLAKMGWKNDGRLLLAGGGVDDGCGGGGGDGGSGTLAEEAKCHILAAGKGGNEGIGHAKQRHRQVQQRGEAMRREDESREAFADKQRQRLEIRQASSAVRRAATTIQALDERAGLSQRTALWPPEPEEEEVVTGGGGVSRDVALPQGEGCDLAHLLERLDKSVAYLRRFHGYSLLNGCSLEALGWTSNSGDCGEIGNGGAFVVEEEGVISVEEEAARLLRDEE
jgi:hypothetical protein